MNRFLILLLVTMIIFGYSRHALTERVLAEVGPYKLFESDVMEIMKNDPQIKEILKLRPELKDQVEKTIVERWINISLLAIGAKGEKLDTQPLVKKKLEEAGKMILAEELLQRELQKLNITEREMQEFYEKNKDQYKEPEAVKLRHILIFVPQNADNKTREKAFTRAKQIRSQLLKGAKFEELAKIHSDDTASREKGGDLGTLRRGETMPEFEDKVFNLKPGEISNPIASPFGYHIVKVEKKIPESLLPYDKAKEQVKEDLKKEKEREILSNLIESLKQKNPPKIYLKDKESKEGAR
ncbi:MAG: peptidylprolyl isomerase [Caldimicrobium sp.]|nr:peptidylprolyl isomerase [Caldimicrobium sp.]MCX7613806.1 peptidylprolyl isomerase [Caldimicrobium sp.]MDW8182633.1 peptidylprolyl isomerase [Caldimicrobium sp.]